MQLSQDITATLDAAAKNYRNYPSVCGVSYGAKYSGGELLEGVEAVQFFVTEKTDPKDLPRTLPKYVFQRSGDGRLDRGTQIPTDVIELRNLQLCCQAGDGVGNEFGAEGSVALFFENQADGGRAMLATCSHVASDLMSDGQTFEVSGGVNGCFFLASTAAFTVVEGDFLEFDIAVAEVTQIDELAPNEVRGDDGPLVGFADPGSFAQGDVFACRSGRQGAHEIILQSAATTFRDVEADGLGFITVANLYACQGVVERGDSGGIVYAGDLAVGIIVAKADDGWVFIHALVDAFAFLETRTGFAVEVF